MSGAVVKTKTNIKNTLLYSRQIEILSVPT